MKITDLSGQWNVTIANEQKYVAFLPGTLDENRIGYKDSNANQWNSSTNATLPTSDLITTRLTRAYTYEGVAVYEREFAYHKLYNKERVFIDVERTRKLALKINGHNIDPYIEGTISTPYTFEITKYIQKNNVIEFLCDNSYQDWPHDAILYSSAATDETQTNWNGILGYLRIREEKETFLSSIRVYPHNRKITIKIEIDTMSPYEGSLYVRSTILDVNVKQNINLETAGKHTIIMEDVVLSENCQLWDEYEGNLYEIYVTGDELESKTVTFGVRDFGKNENGHLTMNGRNIFLRGDANCCVFPETGHMPVTKEEWKVILEIYTSYGFNCVRFHSHCPPEAAFEAADELGILMQPELSHWNPKTAFEDEESFRYYQLELEQILRNLANHPSFVMLTFGNELACNEVGHQRMKELLQLARSMDPTRMYANGSNNHYGENGADISSDFYTSSNFYKKMFRGTSSPMIGHINQSYPNSSTAYDQVIEEIRTEYSGPVFSFEVGQYEILPDFDEINDFQGVTIPNNLKYIKDQVEHRGFYSEWKKRVEATGELARIAYREEIEAALRTRELSGISLLGLQDFPGQGTALVGMLNSHFQPKPYDFAQPEQFRKFFREVLPLVLLDKYTYSNKEILSAMIEIANYGKKDIDVITYYELKDGTEVVAKGSLPGKRMPSGEVTEIGNLEISLENINKAKKLIVTVSIAGIENEYPIWVYPELKVTVPDDIIITKSFAETQLELAKGKKVFYTPEADEQHFPNSAPSQFTTDFWSVGTFPVQSGCMGCLIENTHPVFREFPTEFHSNWQWWPMSNGRAVVIPEDINPIVTVMDCYARLRRMAFLMECKVGDGKLMISSMGLLEKQEYPEVRALTNSILTYMSTDEFEPKQEIAMEKLKEFIQ